MFSYTKVIFSYIIFFVDSATSHFSYAQLHQKFVSCVQLHQNLFSCVQLHHVLTVKELVEIKGRPDTLNRRALLPATTRRPQIGFTLLCLQDPGRILNADSPTVAHTSTEATEEPHPKKCYVCLSTSKNMFVFSICFVR